jgi:hypothetical protein
VALTAGLALLYPAACYLAVVVGIGVGTLPLALNGGVVDYDGLPVFLAGPISAALPVLLYLVGTGTFASTVAARHEGVGGSLNRALEATAVRATPDAAQIP